MRRTGDAARQDVAVRLKVPRAVEAQVTVVGFLIPGKDAGVVVWSQSLARVGRFGAAQHPVTSRGPLRRVRNGVPLVDAPCSCGTLDGDRKQRSSQLQSHQHRALARRTGWRSPCAAVDGRTAA